jgi:hypothetical protein
VELVAPPTDEVVIVVVPPDEGGMVSVAPPAFVEWSVCDVLPPWS